MFLNFIKERDKNDIQGVGKPMSPCSWGKEADSYLRELYSKYNARTHKQKIAVLVKESGWGRPGRIHFTGMYREPSWKIRQFNLRATEHIFLFEHGIKYD